MSNRNEEVKSVVVTLEGEVRYPKTEDGVFTMALAIDTDLAAKKLYDACKSISSQVIGMGTDEDGANLLNAKSRYDFPVFDYKTHEKLNGEGFKICHGARGFLQVTIKPYNYRGRTGLTAYINGFVMKENGVQRAMNDWQSIMADYE